MSDDSYRQQFFDRYGHRTAIGDLAMSAYRFCDFAIVKSNGFQGIEDISRTLGDFGRTSIFFLHNFMTFLWFIKDNSASIHEAICTATLDKTTRFKSVGHMEFATTAKGTSEVTSFTQNELTTTAHIYNHFKEITQRKYSVNIKSEQPDTAKNEFIDIKIRDYSAMPSIERALGFVWEARKTAVLPNKLAAYMIGLESLFVPESGGQLSEKASQRVSRYLEGDINNEQLYNLLRDAYKVRSKYLHGDELPEQYRSIDALRLLCEAIDDVSRRAFTKTLMIDHTHFATYELQKQFARSLWNQQ